MPAHRLHAPYPTGQARSGPPPDRPPSQVPPPPPRWRSWLLVHRDGLDRLVELLLERETLDGTDVDEILGRVPGQRQPVGATGHTTTTAGVGAP